MVFHANFDHYIKWGFESRLKHPFPCCRLVRHYIKWGFESRLKLRCYKTRWYKHYIKWGFESRLKQSKVMRTNNEIISNGDLRVG